MHDGNGPCGRIRTRTGSVLSGVSLLLDYAGKKGEKPRMDSHHRPSESESDVLLLNYGAVKNKAAYSLAG